METVKLPPEDSLDPNEVSYAIGTLTASKRQEAANKYMGFLQAAARAAYARFGFINASKSDRNQTPSPDRIRSG